MNVRMRVVRGARPGRPRNGRHFLSSNCKWREGTRREPKIPLQRPPLAKPHLSPCTARHETAARAGSGVFPGKARVMEGEDCDTEDYKKRRAEFVEKVFRFHERRG